MEVLKNRFNGVYKKIKDAEEDNLFELNMSNEDIVAEIVDKKNDFIIYIEETRRSGYTMRVKKGNKEVYFHSKYNPEQEAKKIVKNFGFSPQKQIFAIGFGLGYYLKQFSNNNKFDKVFVIEPFLSIFYAALCYNDLSVFLKQNNLIIVLEEYDYLFDISNKYLNLDLDREVDFLEHKPSFNLFPKEYKEIYKNIKEIINFKKIGITTNIVHAKKWRNNILENAKNLIEKPKVDIFFNEFKNKPAICVGAGPSLDKNIEYLKSAENNSIVLAVDTAVGALLKNDIQPDFIVTMDAKKSNYLKHLSEHLSSIEVDTVIISELASHPLLQQNWKGKTAFFTMKRNLSQWIEKITGDFNILDTGGTVSHSMVDFAYKMGANPIILIGQDLAYTDMKSHASNTAFEKRNISDKKLIEIDGINGKVYTDKGLLSMATFFNNYFNKHQDREFIDATEGGVKFDNIQTNDLKSVLNQYCNKKFNIKSRLKDVYSEIDLIKKEKLYKKLISQLNETYNELISSIQITEKQISKIKEALLKLKNEKLLTNDDINKLEISFSKYEEDLHNKDSIKYFVDRLLIPQQMKLTKAKNKYYINKRNSLLNRAEAYLNFREKFLCELKESKDLIEAKYYNELN
jgi:hypothetical protein